MRERGSDVPSLERRVAAVFDEALKIQIPSYDTDLLATGLLDSLGFVELLVQLENRFGIHVRLESLEPSDFRSIVRIAAFVEHQAQAVSRSVQGNGNGG